MFKYYDVAHVSACTRPSHTFRDFLMWVQGRRLGEEASVHWCSMTVAGSFEFGCRVCAHGKALPPMAPPFYIT